jgi:hypothetical protein
VLAILYIKGDAMRAITALLTAALLLSGCGDVYINGAITVNHFPSKTQEKFPRGNIVLACTTVAAIMDYVENGGLSAGCAKIPMTAARKRSEFYTPTGLRVVIYEFRYGANLYFTVAHN